VGDAKVFDDAFCHEFGAAVRVELGAEGVGFVDGDCLWVAVDGGGGGEDNVSDAAFVHAFEEDHGALDVDVVVTEWDRDGFRDGFETGEMDDRVDFGVGFEDGEEEGFVGDVGLVEDEVVGWFLSDSEDSGE
jgi:hypothetical protein